MQLQNYFVLFSYKKFIITLIFLISIFLQKTIKGATNSCYVLDQSEYPWA